MKSLRLHGHGVQCGKQSLTKPEGVAHVVEKLLQVAHSRGTDHSARYGQKIERKRWLLPQNA